MTLLQVMTQRLERTKENEGLLISGPFHSTTDSDASSYSGRDLVMIATSFLLCPAEFGKETSWYAPCQVRRDQHGIIGLATVTPIYWEAEINREKEVGLTK
jgi:hypothetical protein